MRDEPKVALVTGGSRGLGRNTALHLARKDVRVILTYRRGRASADSTVSEIAQIGGRAVALRLDVGDTGSFAGFAEQIHSILQTHWQHGNFDFLVNNAGVGIEASFAETTEAQFAELLSVHFRGPLLLAQTLLPPLFDRPESAV
jgi:NAD(P)-dependent dehydrogenase (short-subunit alcohol dehydrogenase family)